MEPQNLTVTAALALLGLDESADRQAVTRAYRRLARSTHPDRSDTADAAGQFDTITAAYRRALDALPTPASEPTTPHVVTRTVPDRLPDPPLGVRLPPGDAARPIIIVGPARVGPLPAHRRSDAR